MKKIIFLTSLILLTSLTFAQTNKRVSAFNYLKDGDLDLAKTAIDKCVVHPKTIHDARAWLYYGQIYHAIAVSKDTNDIAKTVSNDTTASVKSVSDASTDTVKTVSTETTASVKTVTENVNDSVKTISVDDYMGNAKASVGDAKNTANKAIKTISADDYAEYMKLKSSTK